MWMYPLSAHVWVYIVGVHGVTCLHVTPLLKYTNWRYYSEHNDMNESQEDTNNTKQNWKSSF